MESYKAICTKQDEIISRTVGTKQEIVPGDLLKIMIVKGFDTSNHYIIKMYDRENQCFHKDLYQCNTTSIVKLEENIWSLLSEVRHDANITLSLGAADSKTKVDFRIKLIGDVPNLGAGRFFVLELIENHNFTEDLKLCIRNYKCDQSESYTIRADRLIEYLRVDESEAEQPVPFTQNNFQLPSISNPSTNSSKEESKPEVGLIDWNDRNQINQCSNVTDQMDCDEFEERNVLTESSYNFENQEQNGMNEYARQAPITLLEQKLIRLQSVNYFSSNAPNPKQSIKDFCSPSNKTFSNDDGTSNSLAKSYVPNSYSEVSPIAEDIFVYRNDNSNEVLFYCKQHNCNGFWFVDKTEGKNIYVCPICEKYNCFQCEVIHENMSCEEYQQHKSSAAPFD